MTLTYGLFQCQSCGREWPDELQPFPAPLRGSLADWAESLEDKLGRLPDDATLCDAVLRFIDRRPEEGRAMLERLVNDEDEWHQRCRCCDKRGELIVPLVPLAAA